MYCQCGCGRLASIAKRNDKQKGIKKGESFKYIRGHYFKGKKRTEENCKNISRALQGHSYMTTEEKEKRSKKYTGEGNPNWKGGLEKIEENRVIIYLPNHPRAHKGRIRRYTIKAEKALGRYLKNNEVVHHIKNDATDDRNCNLLICTHSYHASLHHRMRKQNSEYPGNRSPG